MCRRRPTNPRPAQVVAFLTPVTSEKFPPEILFLQLSQHPIFWDRRT